jgi:hypothetical protein
MESGAPFIDGSSLPTPFLLPTNDDDLATGPSSSTSSSAPTPTLTSLRAVQVYTRPSLRRTPQPRHVSSPSTATCSVKRKIDAKSRLAKTPVLVAREHFDENVPEPPSPVQDSNIRVSLSLYIPDKALMNGSIRLCYAHLTQRATVRTHPHDAFPLTRRCLGPVLPSSVSCLWHSANLTMVYLQVRVTLNHLTDT